MKSMIYISMYVKRLAREVEAIKLFMKEQFYGLRKSVSEINSNTNTAENTITETKICFASIMSFYYKKTHRKTV